MNYRKITTWLLLLFCCIVLLSSFRQNTPDTKQVEAEEFVLKDSSGRTRAVLGVHDGEALIEFYDENGAVTAKVPNKGWEPVQARISNFSLLRPDRAPRSVRSARKYTVLTGYDQ